MSAILNLINQAALPADRHRIMTDAAREEFGALNKRIAELEIVVRWYYEDDVRSVENEILENVNLRPAAAVLKGGA